MDTPADDTRIDLLTALVGLDLPDACRPGVRANLALLDHYAALVMDFPLPPEIEPAPEYRP
ncbi:DUF4089 domain-containing protein [Sphingomonas naphthae]|uniref:DUF4089 domain-containing protein n=1 Tax=Sphingomonas naphthae TaxID=1813468 RepID=A0ABY7TKI2_9SPHN|nr:DUF4089 domain-containing protein [Sphingomonas naphthae]WCT73732.1 DUF4089 domain-containing protein [Sphingomonas naphthae]